jgi:prepilin-type N-terminal cleavage/methylation domain-containing protein
MPKQPSHGFVLIELVTTLILVGVIGAFASLFLYNGINGYLASKRNSETALKAQGVLDRISAELRHISTLVADAPPVVNTSITYRSFDSKLTGTRTIRFDNSGLIFLKIKKGTADQTENLLLDKVTGFKLDWESADLDNADGDDNPATGSQEVAMFRIEFQVEGVETPFRVKIHPRVFIAKP